MDKFRWQKLRTKIQKGQGILITDKGDLFYLTGFKQEDYWGLLTKGKFFLLLPPLLYEQAKNYFDMRQKEEGLLFPKSKPPERFILFRGKDLFFLFSRVIRKEKLKTIVFEADKISFAEVEKLEKVRKIKFYPRKGILSNLREIKNTEEINSIRKSCQLALCGYQYTKKIIHPGMSELEVANEIEYYLKKQGAEKVAFETIVAGGMNSSYPHHLTSDYIFKKNDLVLLDLGVVYQGYTSDLTRVIFLGKISPFIRKIYQMVKKAQKNAFAGIKPGIEVKEIFSRAYRVLKEAGYAKYFPHNLGHGIGIDIHEKPYLSSKNREVLKPGMVFTIEPGIYIPQKFGIRIEDVVLVTEKGHKVLNKGIKCKV